MADLLQIDAAARLVGKSEVTIRRLIKAGKLRAEKEKTPTGFIYRIPKNDLLAYYHRKEAVVNEVIREEARVAQEEHVQQGQALSSNGKVRLAVSDETGNSAAYWLKRAEIYEEKFNTEVRRTSEMREELGIWRGRAEHAQAMLMKMLPAPGNPIEIPHQAGKQDSPPKSTRKWELTYVALLSLIFILTAVSFTYVIFTH